MKLRLFVSVFILLISTLAYAVQRELLTPLPESKPAPNFILEDTQGNTHSLSDYRGKVVILNFWATWCRPCRKEMPALAELRAQYGDRGFQVVGVALDRPEAVAKFTTDVGADYPQLIGRERAIAVADRYGNHYGALPYSVLVDRQGLIRFIRLGKLSKQELEAELLKLL